MKRSQSSWLSHQWVWLSISEAIRPLMLRIADEKWLPFAVEVPNIESRRAMKEIEAGKGHRSASASALFKDLGI